MELELPQKADLSPRNEGWLSEQSGESQSLDRALPELGLSSLFKRRDLLRGLAGWPRRVAPTTGATLELGPSLGVKAKRSCVL